MEENIGSLDSTHGPVASYDSSFRCINRRVDCRGDCTRCLVCGCVDFCRPILGIFDDAASSFERAGSVPAVCGPQKPRMSLALVGAASPADWPGLTIPRGCDGALGWRDGE